MHRAFVVAAVLYAWLAGASVGVHAQSVPPPPSEQKPAAEANRDGEPLAEATKPVRPTQPRPADGILGDIEDQNDIAAIERERDEIRQLVLKARTNVQNFNFLREKLADIIAAGKCAGTASVLASIARQEEDARALLQNLDKNCKSSGGESSRVATMCREERRKLDDELKSFTADRAAVRRMCPSGEG